jgi:alkaline phosphatase D
MQSMSNVILLSGDRHEFAAIKFNAEGAGHTIVEVSTSPMSMFWVPLVRTLDMASKNTVKQAREVTTVVDGVAVTETVLEEVPQEQVLKYIPQGNHKWYVSVSILW